MPANRTPGPVDVFINMEGQIVVRNENGQCWICICDRKRGDDRANADFIALSWNSHDALVGIGKKILKDADNSVDDDIDSSGWTKYVWVSRKNLITLESALREAGEEV